VAQPEKEDSTQND